LLSYVYAYRQEKVTANQHRRRRLLARKTTKKSKTAAAGVSIGLYLCKIGFFRREKPFATQWAKGFSKKRGMETL